VPNLKTKYPPFLLVGATASGKSSLAVELASHFDYEIWSTDSRQCYKYLEIGTAAPTAGEIEKVLHHNIGVLNPDEKESATLFLNRLESKKPNWMQPKKEEKSLLFVGGSTLHAQTLLLGIDDMPTANTANISKLQAELDAEGPAPLLARLKKVDPVYAEIMEGFNKQRCFRALDVWMQSGKPFSSFHTMKATTELKPAIPVVGIQWERDKLYTRINERVDQMWENGLVEEYECVLEKGFPKNSHALQGVGYDEVANFLENKMTRAEAIEKMKTKTRRYAKRQLTWFKRWPFIHWIDAEKKPFMNLCNWVEALPNKR
jgi:tRNA dimethylallyltransferase